MIGPMHRRLVTALLVLLALWPSVVFAQIYRWLKMGVATERR